MILFLGLIYLRIKCVEFESFAFQYKLKVSERKMLYKNKNRILEKL